MAPKETSPPHGERTIEVTLRFWTDRIADKEGHVIPGFCWEGCFVSVPSQPSHGIKTTAPMMSNHFGELVSTVQAALDEAGVKVLLSGPVGRKTP